MTLSPAYPDRAALSPAYPVIDTLGPAYPTGQVVAIDDYHAQFVAASTQYAKITDANYGDYSDYTKLSFAFTYQRDSTGLMYLMGQYGATNPDRTALIGFSTTDKLRLILYHGANQVIVDTAASFTDIASRHSLLVTVDSDADTVAFTHDGSNEVHGGVGLFGALNNSSADINIGGYNNGTSTFDGKIHAGAVVSGNAGLVYSDVFDGSGNMFDLTGLSGIHEQWLFENNWNGEVLPTALTPVNAPAFGIN